MNEMICDYCFEEAGELFRHWDTEMYLCRDCYDEVDKEDAKERKKVSEDDERWKEICGGKDIVIVGNREYEGIKHVLFSKEGFVWRTLYEGDDILSDREIASFDWDMMVDDIRSGRLYVVEDEEGDDD